MPFCDMIGHSTILELAQGFGLVTPDPFSSRELGGVWARNKEGTGADAEIEVRGDIYRVGIGVVCIVCICLCAFVCVHMPPGKFRPH